jgi:murein DD-endopeptidase MepM/ murein hydrolase activator NlpD
VSEQFGSREGQRIVQDQAVQHRAKHRRETARLRRSRPVTSARKRHAGLTATLVAGVGLAGLSAGSQAQAAPQPSINSTLATSTTSVPANASPADTATTSAAPSSAATSSAATSSATAAEFTASSATAAEFTDEESVVIPPTVDATGTGRVLSWQAPARKSRPVAPAITALWVDPLPEASVTSCFGQRWGRLHAGIDLATAEGTRIRAAGAGVVIAAGPAEGYGNAVLIDHGDGFLTHYGHMDTVEVTVGQKVKTGEEIGTEGSTGHSTGPHLHFEVHKGSYKNPIEPTQWLHDHGVDIPGCVAFTTRPKADNLDLSKN